MPLTFNFDIKEGKVYRSKKRTEEDDEKAAIREIQTILASRNRKACDCEAQVHELLENCLNCGRLCCDSEGPGKCFHCGSLVMGANQRERLKKYIDVTQAPTTSKSSKDQQGLKIIDDQFDYFTIDSKKDLKEGDRRKLRDNLDELQAQRYKRKLVLNVDIDQMTAGPESRPQIEDYDEALRDLRLDCQYSEVDSKFTLTELVQKESRRNFDFEYVEKSTK